MKQLIKTKKVIITESTREVLFLQTDWCQQLRMATTAPLLLPHRRSRRLRGQKPLSPSRLQVEEEWSGASPTPPSGGVTPFRGSALAIRVIHQRLDTMYSRTLFPGIRTNFVRLLHTENVALLVVKLYNKSEELVRLYDWFMPSKRSLSDVM